MLILSASPYSRIPRPRLSSFSTSSVLKAAAVATVSSSAATSRLFPISCFVGVKSRSTAVFCASLKVRGMAEIVEDKKESNSSSAAAAMAVTASENDELPQSRAFLDARTGEDLLSAVRQAVEDEKLPLNVAEGMEELYQNYQNAVK